MILIAGSTGIIGTHIVDYFQKESIDSLGLGLERSKKEKYIQLDLADEHKVSTFAESVDNISVLIFLTGLAHSKGKRKDYDAFYRANVKTLINLVESLKKHQKLPRKIIFASTVSIYGERWKQTVYDEDLLPRPQTPYAKTKLEAEKYLAKYYSDRIWILRFAPVYSDNFLLNINRRTKIRDNFYKTCNGEKKLSLCNVDNIKVVIKQVIEDKVPFGTYNISDPIVYKYSDLLSAFHAGKVLKIPLIFFKTLHIIGKILNNKFLVENSAKLCTDNIFPSEKIGKYVKLDSTISNLKLFND